MGDNGQLQRRRAAFSAGWQRSGKLSYAERVEDEVSNMNAKAAFQRLRFMPGQATTTAPPPPSLPPILRIRPCQAAAELN